MSVSLRVAGGPLVLASTSPQRKRLLEQLEMEFEVYPIACEEDLSTDQEAEALVASICHLKMQAAYEQIPGGLVASRLLLTADTLVSLDHHRLGKPADASEAERFLDLLSGRTHQVLTGICLSIPGRGEIVYGCSVSDVRFRKLDEQSKQWYLKSGEWSAAAGGYRIQGLGAGLIEHISGSYTGIIGLPLDLVYDMIAPYREP